MTVAELEHFNELLLQQEHSLADWLDTADSVQAGEVAKVNSLLDEIREAMGRIANQSFGKCQPCDGVVELHRLGLHPTTQICLDCISEKEKATLEDDLFFASKIHRALLPQATPKIKGFEVAFESKASNGIGGDYFDFLKSRRPGSTLVAIADAMGKGVAAGLLMSNVQGILRVLAGDFDAPGLLMKRLNQ